MLAGFWLLLTPVYAWAVWRRPWRTNGEGGIYRIWAEDRIEFHEGEPKPKNLPKAERLHRRGPAALGWGAYFSLLSAFHIGFREFSVGTWIARVQAHEYLLKPTGWVRTVSGAQSLLSVYLLAMWVLTYFGRPFQ